MQPPNQEIGMPQKHRDHIIKNRDKLVRATNYSNLMNECVRVGILSSSMRSIIEDVNERFNMSAEEFLHSRHCKLFEKITRRGPKAYNMLIQALRNINCIEAAELLESVDETSSRPPFISIKERNTIRNSADIVDTPSSTQGDGACISKVTSLNLLHLNHKLTFLFFAEKIWKSQCSTYAVHRPSNTRARGQEV